MAVKDQRRTLDALSEQAIMAVSNRQPPGTASG
jgi:hypothetical protein